MRLRLWLYAALLFGFALGAGVEIARTATFEAMVKQSLLSLIATLQDNAGRSTDDHDAAPPRQATVVALAGLGRPLTVVLSSAVAAQGLQNICGVVVHENGVSQWNLGVLDGGEIAAYSFSIEAPVVERASANVEADNNLFGEAAGGASVDVSAVNTDFRNSTITDDHARRPASTIATIAPSSAQPTTTTPPAAPPPAIDPRVVEFLFASTRQQIAGTSAQNVSFSGERGPLTFGAASVRIPDDHKIGRIELPSSWKLFGLTWSSSPDEHAHFIIKRVVPLSQGAFGQVIKEKNARSALVFIHGFNTTFEDALYRNAQIVWDLQYKGVSVLFSWASRGEAQDYLYDKDSAYLARSALIALLEKLKKEYGIEQVNVLAHSMGNLIALDALSNYAQTANPVQIARLVMAAPDVDADQFKLLAPSAKAIVGGMTLYASSADRAMTLSRTLAGGVPRAGDVPPGGPIVLPSVDTIDVTAVGDDIFGLNHNVFAESRDVLEDISAMLKFGLPPPRLIQIRGVPDPPAAPAYWKYIP